MPIDDGSYRVLAAKILDDGDGDSKHEVGGEAKVIRVRGGAYVQCLIYVPAPKPPPAPQIFKHPAYHQAQALAAKQKPESLAEGHK